MVRTSLLVARTEFRRTTRAVSNDRTKLVTMALLALFLIGIVSAAAGYLLPELGERFAEGISAADASLATDLVSGGIAVGWIFLVFLTAIRAFTTAADPDKPAFLLTSTSLRNVTVGLIGAEILMFAVWFVPGAILLGGAFAYGAGTILPALLAPLLVCLLLVTAVPIGFLIGICIKHLVTVYEPIARYRVLVFVGFWVLYFGAIITGGFDLVVSRLFTALQDSPLGWPGHILLAGVPNVPASSLAIAGTVAGTAVLSTAAFGLAVVAAGRHWFADPARFEDSEESTESGDETASSRFDLDGVLSRGLPRPIRSVTVTAIRRTKRAPIRLAYAAYPLFGMIAFIQEIVQTGTVPTHVAVILSLYVVWAAGALFTLNPLGDLGRGLPAVMTSTISGRQAITGLVVAGALVAAPIAFLVSLALGVVSPLSFERTAALVAATTVGAVVTPALASGIGTVVPRFGSVKVTNNREAVMPSKTAFIIYSLAIMLPAVAALVLYVDSPELIAGTLEAVSTWAPTPTVSVSARGITLTAWAVLIGGLLAPVVSYLYAVERFDWYTLE
ncbi:hypothetical protein [Haloterrigena alkaliphila]|uniref:ABC-2 type transport system permease protein n=1 Tax=Haloterrigena alkaliphila TaxID=2816475 RepID=A0A8A2VDR6_9EURY|nr:hypothetical protein [Haloterrigena alkaliphila]QSX00190.1 hypothetical protein J0X25_04285 [Haloterrigena alkaliphila]